MKRCLVIIMLGVLIMSCTTMQKMEKDIDDGMEKAANRLPRYELVIVPVNEEALAIAEENGNEWKIPEKYRVDK